MQSKFKSISLVLVMAIITSCGSKVEKAATNSVATFYVDSIDGSSSISKVDAIYSIPKERLYNFKACVKDILQSKSIQGQSFKIQGGDIEKNINTDEQGCLNWTETVSYNFLAQSNYIQIARTLVANGVHKGSNVVNFVLNPWSRGDDITGVIDPNKKAVSSLVSGSSAMSALVSEGTHSPLWAIGPRVTIADKNFTNSGASMSLKFQTKLSLVLLSTTLQKVQYQISNGKFNVEMFLYNSIVENGVEKIIPLASADQKDVSFVQDTLIAEFPFTLNVLPNKGQVLLGIKISAPNNEMGLDPFEGVYVISDSANIKFDGSPSIAQNAIYSQVKNTVEEKGTIASVKDTGLQKPGIDVDKLDIKFFKLGSESTTDRQVFFTIKACMRSNLDSKPIKDEEFSVKTISANKIVKLKSDANGCVAWDDSIWHKFFGKEHFIKTNVTISNTNYNLKKTIPVSLNPWDGGSNFARDGRFVDDLGSVAVNPSSEGAKISIDSYQFSVSGFNYDINKNLDLSVIKNGSLSLNAKVVNHSSMSYGRMGYENLRDGQYLLKWAVVTLGDNSKLDSVISNGQKVVSVFGGGLRTDLAIKVSAFDKLTVRSRIIVGLYTIKEGKSKSGGVEIDRNSGLGSTPFMATIILNNDQDSQKMDQVENNLGLGAGDLFEKIAAKNVPASMIDYTSKVLASQNLKKLVVTNEKETLFLRDGLANPQKFYTQTQTPSYYHEAEMKPAISSNILADFAKSGKLTPDLAARFCKFWVNDYFRRLKPDLKDGALSPNSYFGITQSCLDGVTRDPNKYFVTEKKLIVKKLGGFTYKNGTSTGLSVSNSFSVSKSDTNSVSKTWSWSTSAGLSFELFDVFKVGTTGSYAVSSSNSKSDSTSSSASVSASTNLYMQTSVFDVQLDAYEECTSIRLNPELFIGKGARLANIWSAALRPQEIAKIATSGFFICTGTVNNTPVVKRESYYLVSQDLGASRGEQDAYSANNHMFFMTFRGQRDLNNFLGLIQGSASAPSSANTFDGKNNLAKRFSTLPSWPGVYSESN